MKFWAGTHFAFVGMFQLDSTTMDNYGGGTFTLVGKNYQEPFYITGVYADDMKHIIAHFKGTTGKNPDQACQWEDEDFQH